MDTWSCLTQVSKNFGFSNPKPQAPIISRKTNPLNTSDVRDARVGINSPFEGDPIENHNLIKGYTLAKPQTFGPEPHGMTFGTSSIGNTLNPKPLKP